MSREDIDNEDLERNVGFLLVDVARLLKTSYDRRVKQLDLTRSQWWVLNHVYRHEGIRQSELADILEIERAALGRLIDRLEANGWVRREPDPADRRAKLIYLTEDVAPIMVRMRRIARELRNDATRGLSNEQRGVFVDTLLSVKANLIADLDSNQNTNQNRREISEESTEESTSASNAVRSAR